MSITSDYTAMHRAFREVANAHGLRTESVRVVVALDEHGIYESVTALGRRMGLHDTAVHRALRELRSVGAIDRDDVQTELGLRVAGDVYDAERGAQS